MADLIMKLVRQSLDVGQVDVLAFLLSEARKWSVVIELRRPSIRSSESGGIVLYVKRLSKRAVSQESETVSLAAEASVEEGQMVAETVDRKQVGILNYDYRRAALVLDVTGELPAWNTVDVEIETQGGRRITSLKLPARERPLVLKQGIKPVKDVTQITLKPSAVDTRQ